MNDENIRKSIRPAFDEAESSEVPGFNEVWANAEVTLGDSSRRNRVLGGAAAAIVVMGLVASLWPAQHPELSDDYLIVDALLNSTSWSAPSDSLMPEHQFDIYQEILFLNESTISQEGTLL